VRPALICDDVSALELDGFKADVPAGAEPVVWLNQVRDPLLRGQPQMSPRRVLRVLRVLRLTPSTRNRQHDLKQPRVRKDRAHALGARAFGRHQDFLCGVGVVHFD